MNLSDVKDEALLLGAKLKCISETIDRMSELIQNTEEWVNSILPIVVNKDIVGSTSNSTVNNAQIVKNSSKSYYRNFTQGLRNIDFSDALISLADLENNFNHFNVNDFIEEYRNSYKTIHRFIRCPNSEESTKLFIITYTTIKKIIREFNLLRNRLFSLEYIHNELIEDSNKDSLKIRLLKEDNDVQALIDNMQAINDLYNSISEILGCQEEKLRYKRAESGTFEIDLTGCLQTLVVLAPILTFFYKVYSENFSWKAKQDKQIGEIKVRKELLGLIKEVSDIETVDNGVIQKCLADMELSGRKLFINNPTIKLNNVKIGLNEETANIIDKAYLEDHLPAIESKEIALDEEVLDKKS